MKQLFKRLLALCLTVVLLGTLVLQAAPAAQAADYLNSLPQLHYGEYGTVNMVYDQGNCYSMQGMTVDTNYTYCAKIGSNDAVACIVRLQKSDGAKTVMTNTANSSYYFYNLGHANALDLATINGVNQLFVTAGATLVRLTINDTKLTTAGTYTFSFNGTTTNMTAVQLMSVSSTLVKVIAKSGRTLYTGTLDPTVSSGDIALTRLCTLDISKIRLKGEIIDYSKFTQQGFDYHDGKIFLPLTGNAYEETINYSIVVVYDIEGATGTVYNDPTLSFRIISGQYSGLFEIEDVAICNTDRKLYFSSNRRKTASDTNYDGVSFFLGYKYNPSMSTTAPADYRWETVNNEWVTTSQGGNVFNNPIQIGGPMSNNTMSSGVYYMSRSVKLMHDRPWVVEWKSSGSFGGGGMLLSGGATSYVPNEPYIFRYKNSTFISMGYYEDNSHHNYGIRLSDYGIDGVAEHVYRLTNKIASDGSNMVYLSVDGKQLGALNNYYIGLSDQNKKVDWLNGKDLTFSYQGTFSNTLDQCKLDYLQVWADGAPAAATNSYRWESLNDNLTSVTAGGYTLNTPTIYNGSVSGSTYTNACFRLSQPLRLLHNQRWSVEWQSEGTTSSTFLLSAGEGGKNVGAPYLFRYGANLIFLGANDGSQHANYGIDLSKHGIDGTVKHTYRLSNKIASDGSNMVYLYVDGTELGPMNNIYGGIAEKGTTSNWLNGKDLVFDYVGNRTYAVSGTYQYLQVLEDQCDHSYTSKITTVASCTTPGVKTYTCSNCGEQYTETIVATGHSYTSTVIAPTCTSKGYTSYRCACGDSYTSNEVAAKGHSYQTVTVDATCTEDGAITNTCTACGDTQVEVIPAKGHSYKSLVIEPTCTTQGYTTYYCSCGNRYTTDVVSATGHSYTSKITTAATCTADGVRTYTCGHCGSQYTEPVPATGHSYSSSKVVAPTCTSKGYTTYSCACGASYNTNEVAALGHSYQAVITAAPSCESTGVKTFTCKTCGYAYTEQLAATGHKYTAKVTAPTCTTKGYTTYTCACGDTYTANEMAALGHSFASGICTACGAADPNYVKPVVIPTLTLKAPALEFKDMITVNAFYTVDNAEDIVEMGMLTYTEKVDVVDYNTASCVIPGATYEESSGRYYSSSQGIHGKFLGDTVYLACYAKLTDGSFVYTKLAPYSPITYATNQLKNSTNTALKQLVAAMLNYGAAAQNYFGYNTDVLANNTLTDAQKALPESYRADMVSAVPAAPAAKQGIFANNKGFSQRKPAVSFEGAFSINYFFTPAYTPVGGITLYYWTEADFNAASVLTTANASGSIAMEGSGMGQYRGDIEGIAAKDLAKAVYVAAIYSDGTTTWTSGVLGYSIGAYCSNLAKNTDAMAELAKATAVYGYHAKAYFG